jgi:actinin alpha
MNKEWENVQQRVFTKWCNSHLRKRGREIKDLITDTKDGVQLINLYEIISDEQLAKWYHDPKSKFHAIANLNVVLDKINAFVSSVGIKVQFGAEQIYESDKRQILGMIWCLIHKFEIQDISEEELSAKEGLLLWCKKKTQGYKDVNVKNFSDSWEDGLAFCALIHKHRPDLIDFDSLNKEDRLKNLQLAFDVAEKHLDIPQLLDAQDMVNFKPDEKAVMTYVAYYWKKFASSNKADKAAKRIGNAAKKQRDLEQLQHDYERRAKELIDWTNGATDNLANTDNLADECNSLPKAEAKNNDFKDFKTNVKPKKEAEKNDLELLLTNIRSKQKSEGLPLYNPPAELSPNAIQELWEKLGLVQEKYDKVIREIVTKMRRLDVLLARFRARAKKTKDWQGGKISALASEDENKYDTISSLQARCNTLETQQEEVASVNRSIETTNSIGNEIVANKHEASPEVQSTMEDMGNQQQQVVEQTNDLKKRLEDRLKKLEEIQRKCLEFARKIETLNLFLEDATLALIEPVKANSVTEVEEYEKVVNGLEQEHANQAPALDELKQLNKSIINDGGDPMTFAQNTLPQVEEKYNAVKGDIAAKRQECAVEKETQHKISKLLDKFARLCREYNEWANIQKDMLASDLKGSLEEQYEQLKKYGDTASKEAEKKFQEIIAVHQELEAMNIAERSDISVQVMNTVQEQFKNLLTKRVEAVEQSVIANKATNLSPEQLKELKDAYNHFDKDRDGSLIKLEFKALLAALGEDLPDNEVDKIFAASDKDKDGKINFDEFVAFFSKAQSASSGYDEVMNAFAQLAEGKDVVTEGQLRSCMDKAEVDYLLTKMPQKDGGYDYKAYVNATYGK